MRVLGIDPGFGRMGIAVVEKERGARERVLFSACVTTDGTDPFPIRLTLVVNRVRQVMKKWKPDIVALETLLISKNQKRRCVSPRLAARSSMRQKLWVSERVNTPRAK